jgi:hypothetical protein
MGCNARKTNKQTSADLFFIELGKKATGEPSTDFSTVNGTRTGHET